METQQDRVIEEVRAELAAAAEAGDEQRLVVLDALHQRLEAELEGDLDQADAS